MEQRYNSDGTVTVWVDGAQLRTMEDNELAIFHTPGSSEVYMANRPQFTYDICVATTRDLLKEMGYDFSDGLDSDDVAELTINIDDEE